MRRLAALLGVLTFANLSLVQASGLCPLEGGHLKAPVASASAHHGEHDGYVSPAADETEAVDEAPPPDAGHPSCLMMGPCGLSLDVGGVLTPPEATEHADGVLAHSDAVPASLTTSPDIPPPRA